MFEQLLSNLWVECKHIPNILEMLLNLVIWGGFKK